MSYTRALRQHSGFVRPGEEIKPDPGRHSRDGWTHLQDHTSVYIKGKQYRNMREWTRPCAICGAAFSAFEKAGAVDANSRFSNRTCEAHRNLLPAIDRGFLKWDADTKSLVAGTGAAIGTVDPKELEELRMYKATVKEELEWLYAENKELREKLAKYELPEMMKNMPWQS